jgi:hypothetical protein
MVNIQHHVISHISDHIYGIAGYYSENDSTQHVVIAINNDNHGGTGTLYEIHWNRNTPPTHPQQLWQFSKIHSLSGFFTSDDNFQHVIVATEDGWLHELYFKDPQNVRTRSPLFQDTITPGPHIGQAGFYSAAINGLRVVTVGGADSILHRVAWSASIDAFEGNLATQFHLRDVAAIAGFYAQDDRSGNVIVAMQGGDVFDVYSSGAGGSTTDRLTTFSHRLVNVAAFVSTDTWYRHVIVLDSNGQLYDYSYTPGHVFGQTPLVSIAYVTDIAGYYSAYDQMRHVIVATRDGNIHEVYYGRLG